MRTGNRVGSRLIVLQNAVRVSSVEGNDEGESVIGHGGGGAVVCAIAISIKSRKSSSVMVVQSERGLPMD